MSDFLESCLVILFSTIAGAAFGFCLIWLLS